MNRRRQLVRTCKKHGLHVQPGALKAMMNYEYEYDNDNGNNDEEAFQKILQQLQQKLVRAHPKIVTQALWEQAYAEVNAKSTDAVSNTKDEDDEWRLIQAFDTPKLQYDSLRQQFHYDTNASQTLLGSASDKVNMMTQRYLRIQQRVARMSTLTCIDRLLGTSALASQLLLGMLHRTPNGGLELEDLSGTIPLVLSQESKMDQNGFYTEGIFVLTEGFYDHGVFQVTRLGLPPLESKAQSLAFLPPTIKRSSPQNPLTIYTMTNVAMDNLDVLQELQDLVERIKEADAHAHAHADEQEEVVLVLMGNFTTESLSLGAAMEELARIVDDVPPQHSVLILPGPNDSLSKVWPLPKLKSSGAFSNNVLFVSNPCRLEYGSQEVLLARNDFLQQPIFKVPSKASDATRVVHTMLSQGHLQPQAPIYWNYDHALGLYPLPDLLLLGFDDQESLSLSKAQCDVVACGAGWTKVTLGGRRRSTSLQVEYSQDDDEDNHEELKDVVVVDEE